MIYILDYDGVLAIPFAKSQPFPHTVQCLHEMYADGKNILLLASFNPKACEALISWGVDHLFSCMRYGSNDGWNPPFDENFTNNMKKSIQITNMLHEMVIANIPIEKYSIAFFDDTKENIDDVANLRFSPLNITPVLVASMQGITSEQVCDPYNRDLEMKIILQNEVYATIIVQLFEVLGNDTFSFLGLLFSYLS